MLRVIFLIVAVEVRGLVVLVMVTLAVVFFAVAFLGVAAAFGAMVLAAETAVEDFFTVVDGFLTTPAEATGFLEPVAPILLLGAALASLDLGLVAVFLAVGMTEKIKWECTCNGW